MIHAKLTNGDDVVITFSNGKPSAFYFENHKIGHLDVRTTVRVCDLSILNGAIVEKLDINMTDCLIDAHYVHGKGKVAICSLADKNNMKIIEYVNGFIEIRFQNNQINLELIREID